VRLSLNDAGIRGSKEKVMKVKTNVKAGDGNGGW
jgi:hypothetical protein